MGDIMTLRWFFENGRDVDHHQVGDEEGLLLRQRTEEFSPCSSPRAARLNHLDVGC